MPFTADGNWFDFRDDGFDDRRPALFLDRDGVVIEERHYIQHPHDVVLIEGSIRALKPFVLEGFRLILVSNQAGIGRGILSWDDVFAVQQRLRDLWHQNDLVWDMALLCPHHPEHGQGQYLQDNPWRKPHPGMFEFAASTMPLDLTRSIMVGDRLADLQAAHAAGVAKLVHVLSGHGESERGAVQSWSKSKNVRMIDSIAELTTSPERPS